MTEDESEDEDGRRDPHAAPGEIVREVFDDDPTEIYDAITCKDVEDWDSLGITSISSSRSGTSR
jgi:hypothetical protein